MPRGLRTAGAGSSKGELLLRVLPGCGRHDLFFCVSSLLRNHASSCFLPGPSSKIVLDFVREYVGKPYRDASKLKAARMRRRWNARSEIWRSMHYTSAASCPDSTAGVPLFFFWGRGFMLAGELLSLHFMQLRGIENVCTKFRFVAL